MSGSPHRRAGLAAHLIQATAGTHTAEDDETDDDETDAGDNENQEHLVNIPHT